MKNTRKAILTLLIIVIAAGAGWFAGTRITSPAEVAAQALPPEPSPILVPVEQRVLSTDVITRGTAKFGQPREILLQPSVVKNELGIVTAVPTLGEVIEEGDVLLTVSGRPVLVLAGEAPTYRDMGLGASGVDVMQLEQALARLGYDLGNIDGVYDNNTATAVEAFYLAAKAKPFQPSQDQFATLQDWYIQFGGSSPILIPTSTQSDNSSLPVIVPTDELVFLPELPLRVDTIIAKRGDPAQGPLVKVTNSKLAVDLSLRINDAKFIQLGMPATIDEQLLGIKVTGEVSFIASQPGTHGEDAFHVHAEVAVDDAPPTMIGASVRVKIPVESTAGEVLAIPVSALSLSPDGTSRIQVKRDEKFEYLTVDLGLSASGMVEVVPTVGLLVKGDMVIVGFD